MTIREALEKTGSSTFMNKGSIKAAEGKLRSGEDVLFALIANVSTAPIHGKLRPEITLKNRINGVIVFTNIRVFFCNVCLGSSEYKEIRVDDIQSVDSSKNLLSAQLRICGLTDMLVIDISNKKILQEAENIISEARNALARSSQNAVIQPNEKRSNIDDLRELKSLLDDGIITQDDFDRKKAKILGV